MKILQEKKGYSSAQFINYAFQCSSQKDGLLEKRNNDNLEISS